MKRLIEKLNRIYRPFTVFALCATLVFLIRNEYGRAAAVKEIRSFTQVNRRMLNARAQIQIILIKAQMENRRLTNVEIDTIGRLWTAAEYEQTEEIELGNK